jgi:hypothetical protein
MGSDSRKNQENRRSNLWAVRLPRFGAILPVICIVMDFQPSALKNLCELCWPSAFLLFSADSHFNLAIYSISVAISALIWAGLGWLIGYGLSGRGPGPNSGR